MYLPQSNAILTLIAGGGPSEDYDVPAGADNTKWSGEMEIYVREKIMTQISSNGGSLNKIKDTRLILPGDIDVDFQVDDSVTYIYGGRTLVRKIQDWDDALLPEGYLHEIVHLHLYPLNT